MACALELEKYPGERLTVLSAGSDGIDGNTRSAGAIADPTTVTRAHAFGFHLKSSLAAFDACPMFTALGDAVVTGPTGHNLRDLRDSPHDWCGADNQIDAAVFGAALGGVVAGHGVELGVAGGRDALGRHGLQVEEEAGDARGAGRGELPVGVEFAVWMGMLSVWPSMRRS
jgi:hypothetical protein